MSRKEVVINVIEIVIAIIVLILAVVNCFIDGCTSLTDLILTLLMLSSALNIRKIEKEIWGNKNEKRDIKKSICSGKGR